MNDNSGGIAPPPSTTSVTATAPSSADASTAGAVAQSNVGGATSSTTIKSLQDLQKQAPQLYKQMMLSIATTICQQMQHNQDHLKEIMQQYRQQS